MDANSFITYRPEGIYIVEREGMHLRQVGSLHLYTPRVSEEARFRMMLEGELRRNAEPGTYTGEEANKLVKGLYASAETELKRCLPQLASRSFFEFLLFSHSQWGRLMIKAQQGLLQDDEAAIYWREGAVARRTLRYLLEQCICLSPREQPEASEGLLLSLLDRVYIAARHLVELSNVSDQLCFFYPSDAVLTVFPPRQEQYFEYRLNPAASDAFERLEKMRMEHHTSRGQELEDFTTVWNILRERLSGPFEKEIGIPIDRALGFCLQLKQFVRPAEKSFDVLFLPEERLYADVAQNCSLPEAAVRRVIAGMTLTKEAIEAENRELFDTKRHFQSRLRPFARLPHDTGPHLAWDTDTLEQTVAEIIANLTFGKIPKEWNLPAISRALQDVNQTLSKRFVHEVRERFAACGWRCVTEVTNLIDEHGTRHSIKNDPGEIDVLAVSPEGQTIGQIECKRASPSDDTRSYRDDLSDFYENGEFLKKAKRKHRCLVENRGILIGHLKRFTGARINNNAEVRPLFLTLFPNFAAIRATEIPILTAKVFFKMLTENPQFWPNTAQKE